MILPTPKEALLLAQEAVSCPDWEWGLGMRTVSSSGHAMGIVSEVTEGRRKISTSMGSFDMGSFDMGSIFPDFRDERMTLEVLFMVRKAWGCPDACTRLIENPSLESEEPFRAWSVTVTGDRARDIMNKSWGESDNPGKMTFYGYTQIEALILALKKVAELIPCNKGYTITHA